MRNCKKLKKKKKHSENVPQKCRLDANWVSSALFAQFTHILWPESLPSLVGGTLEDPPALPFPKQIVGNFGDFHSCFITQSPITQLGPGREWPSGTWMSPEGSRVIWSSKVCVERQRGSFQERSPVPEVSFQAYLLPFWRWEAPTTVPLCLWIDSSVSILRCPWSLQRIV